VARDDLSLVPVFARLGAVVGDFGYQIPESGKKNRSLRVAFFAVSTIWFPKSYVAFGAAYEKMKRDEEERSTANPH
jgi:hypothetical protein